MEAEKPNISSVREHYRAGTINAEDIVWLMNVANQMDAEQGHDPKGLYEAALAALMEYEQGRYKAVRKEVDDEKAVNLTLRQRILDLEQQVLNLQREASERA